jgi:glycosyltransferase involved in cell wall biosynthesis
MHVGFLLYNWDGPGGIESQARQLARKLAARGERVTVVTTVAPRAYGRRGIDIENVEVFRVPLTRSPFFEEIARALFASRGGVEVLYAVQFTCGVHAARIARKTGAPVVLKFAGGGAYGDLRTLPSLVNHAALREELGRVDRYVFVSDEIRREAGEYGLDAGKFATIRNGVDLGRFEAKVEPAPLFDLGARVVLYVGRLSEEKRPDLLVRAFPGVLERVAGARLALAGTGPLESSLRALVAEKGLAGKVELLGARGDVPALHRRASVYVLPSASEGSPNALLEALAAGTPAVATDIAAVREIARPEREALLVPADDPSALSRAIVRVLEDQELATKLAAAGPARVREEWDLERVADRYMEVFRECARGRALDWRLGARGRSVLALRALASGVLKRRGERA